MRTTLTLTLILTVILAIAGCNKEKLIADGTSSGPVNDDRPVGTAARALLSDATYKTLHLDVQYMTGFAPDAAALDHLKAFLQARVNKPDGIFITTKEISASSSATLSISDLQAVEAANRSKKTEGNAIAVYVLYTNGEYTENNVLGIAHRNTSVALFGKKIRDNSGGIGQASRTKLEATVLEHEMGHLLGLVDLGTPLQSQHKDAAHGPHCTAQSCLQYYAAETTDILGFLVTGAIPQFDAACLADLRANGGK